MVFGEADGGLRVEGFVVEELELTGHEGGSLGGDVEGVLSLEYFVVLLELVFFSGKEKNRLRGLLIHYII